MAANWDNQTYYLRQRIKQDVREYKLSAIEVIDLIFDALEVCFKFRITEFDSNYRGKAKRLREQKETSPH